MADMTDLPFSRICKDHGARLIFREMVSSEAIVRGNPKTLEMARLDDRERPVIQQIFGSNPATMAEAARIIEETFHPDGIDINMGCPVYKIVSNFDGSSLMRDPTRATEIVRAMKKSVSVPISVKTRLGWSKDSEILEFAKVLEAAGAELLTIHGRTKEQGYSGTANWERIGDVKRLVSIPVILNGDVIDAETTTRALDISGADGVMIGRGALGNPWVFEHVEPSLDERVSVVLTHARRHLEHYGERGMVTFRKHLAYYFKKELSRDHPQIDWKSVRERLMKVSTMDQLETVLANIKC